MNPNRLIRLRGKVIRRSNSETELDEYNEPKVTETTVDVRYYLEPVVTDATRENRQVGDVQHDEQIGFFRKNADVDGWDAFIDQDGERYEFVGPPGLFTHPVTGRSTHYEARLRRTV